MIGIAGAHRTGKTTLAKTVAEVTGFYFLETNAAGTFERLGVSPRTELPIGDRLYIQTEILTDLEMAYAECPTGNFITDRTPLDAAAYMIADVSRTATGCDPHVEADLVQYVNRAIEITEHWFSLVTLVQPGILLVDNQKKAPASPAYIEHINDVLIGLLMGRTDAGLRTNIAMIRRGTLSLHDRVEVMLELTGRYFPHHMMLQDNCSLM